MTLAMAEPRYAQKKAAEERWCDTIMHATAVSTDNKSFIPVSTYRIQLQADAPAR